MFFPPFPKKLKEYLFSIVFALQVISACAQCDLRSEGTVALPRNPLNGVRTTFLDLPDEYGFPIGVAYSKDSNVAFVSFGTNSATINIPHQTYLVVLNTSDFTPTVMNVIPYPITDTGPQGAPEIVLSHDGHFLYTAAGYGGLIIDAARAMENQSNAIVGYLNGTSGSTFGGDDGFDVVVTKDGKYVFIMQEQGSASGIGNVEVFEVDPPATNGSVGGRSIGYISLDVAVTNGQLSPDDRFFYVLSESAGVSPAHTNLLPGVIHVLNVASLKVDPKAALIANVTADCGATRMRLSHSGGILWVANRGSNTVLAFDTTSMLVDPAHARIASISVGTAPDGLILVKNESLLLVANSNRFHDKFSPAYLPNATSGISVIDVEAALRNSPSGNLGQIPTGYFPRDLALSPDGKRVLVSNTNSQQIMVIDVDTLPEVSDRYEHWTLVEALMSIFGSWRGVGQ